MTTERLAALKAAANTYDFWGNPNPKCPHCGETHGISENESFFLYEEGDHEVECGKCGLSFNVVARASFSFDTDEQDEDES